MRQPRESTPWHIGCTSLGTMWRYLLAASILATTLAPSLARADCALGAYYQVAVDANTVTVCPEATKRKCGDAIGLLRQNTADGTVVIVNDVCSNNCYVDSCVPPGTYRYGFATPYDCSEAGCGDLALFEEATVESALPEGCTPAGSTTPATTELPWDPGASATKFKKCDNGCGCAAASVDRTTVRLLDGLAVMIGLIVVVGRARHRREAARRPS